MGRFGTLAESDQYMPEFWSAGKIIGLLEPVIVRGGPEESQDTDLAVFQGTSGKIIHPAKKAQLNGGFINPFDTALWVAPTARENPTLQSQAFWAVHRISGNLGGLVHDASASELRMNNVSNGGAGENAFEASLVLTGGEGNNIPSASAIVANFKTEGGPKGTFTKLSLVNIQQVTALPAEFTIGTLYGLFVDSQISGTINYSLFVNGGTSVIRGVIKPSVKAENGITIRGLAEQEGALFAVQNSATTTLFLVSAAGSVRIGSGLATTATDGFLYLPSSNGPPTGVPTAQTGTIACQYDRSTNKFYAYNGGWKSIQLI